VRSAADAQRARQVPVRVGTSAGRHFPVYHVVVGWPLNVWGGWTGLILARLISAALSAANAFLVLARWSRYGLMLAGLVVAASPMAVEIGGFINPNGLEISAGIALSPAAYRCCWARAATRSRRRYSSEYLGDTIEVLVRVCREGYRVMEMPVIMRPRLVGVPSQSPVRAAIYLMRVFVVLCWR
jgi:hypothetical protein